MANFILMPTTYSTEDQSYRELKILSYESLNMRNEEGKRETVRLKISRCPSYLVMEIRRLKEDTRLDIGAITSALLYKGMMWADDDESIHEILELFSKVRRDGSLPATHRQSLHRTMGNTANPVINPVFPAFLGEPEEFQFRVPLAYYTSLVKQAEELGVYMSSLAVVYICRGLMDLGDGTVSREIYDYLELITRGFLETCERQKKVVSDLYDLYYRDRIRIATKKGG